MCTCMYITLLLHYYIVDTLLEVYIPCPYVLRSMINDDKCLQCENSSACLCQVNTVNFIEEYGVKLYLSSNQYFHY